jgi:hypothetical protein
MPIHDWTRIESSDLDSVGVDDLLLSPPMFLLATPHMRAPSKATCTQDWAAVPGLIIKFSGRTRQWPSLRSFRAATPSRAR